MALVGAALGATALFSYNRENFKFDKEQTIQRETLRLGMQLKRFALFRDDVRDLVTLTVDRMDVYHLIGALFMKFCIIVFCKGRIQASAPPFVLQLFQLSNACAFMYLLLAVWLSMHASIASHSFGVKMLTRFVRLPIPTQKQITLLQAKLIDFEKQGVGNMMRLPFQDHQDWEAVRGKEEVKRPQAAPDGGTETASSVSYGGGTKEAAQASDLRAASAADAGATSAVLLDAKETKPFEDLLSSSRGAMPERHVQLFRQLQFKWQCYDAYCRVCLGLGLNHILQALTYYCICHAIVENRTPTLGFALVVLFQAATIFVAFLDLAGLQHREIITVQIVSIVPSLATALEVSLSPRDDQGKLLPHQDFRLSPLSFLCHAIWLELWLRIAWPSGAEEKLAQLPRRFRQVLFLDPFGDVFWDPNQTGMSLFEALNAEKDTEQTAAIQAAHEAACAATSQLTVAQCALRRWQSVPSWCCSHAQRAELASLESRRTKCGGAICSELERCGPVLPDLESLLASFEPTLRRWQRLPPEEKDSDPFADCLLGPFEQSGMKSGAGSSGSCFYYDLENERTVFSDNVLQGFLVLSLSALSELMEDVETQSQSLIELRILRDLTVARKNREVRARVEKQAHQLGRRSLRHRVQRRLKDDSKRFGTNLVGLFNQKRPVKHGKSWSPVPAENPDDGEPEPDNQDATIRAVAGKHADDFVPERLPWQILCRLTRVCQVTWFMCGFMTLLKELSILQVDFQLQRHKGRQLAESLASLQLEELPVEWPNATFFIPDGLASCNSDVVVSSALGLFLAATPEREEPFRLAPLVASSRTSPMVSTALGQDDDLILLAIGDGVLNFWELEQLQQGSPPSRISVDGGTENWRLLAAGMVPCVEVASVLPSWRWPAENAQCMVLAAWDGEMLPLAALPGRAHTTALELLQGTAEVWPTLTAPLPLVESVEGVDGIHLRGARLWAWLRSGTLQVWDLTETRSLRRWRPIYPTTASMPQSSSIRGVGICTACASGGSEACEHDLLLLGRGSTSGPVLLHAVIPASLLKD